MAGVIGRAFVDIIARFKVEQGGDIEKGLRSQIRDLEGEFDRLEGAAGQAGRAIQRQLGQARINLDVRNAVVDLHRVEDAVDGTVARLRDLQALSPKFNVGKITQDIRRLEEQAAGLGRSLQRIDGQEIDLNVADATRQLQNIERAAVRLTEELTSIPDIRFRPQVESAVADLDRLKEVTDRALAGLERIDDKRVRVKVDDIELSAIQEELTRLTAGTETIKIKVQETGMSAISKGVDRLHVKVEDLGDQFRNIAFRAASFLAVGQAFSAFQRIISFGIEAAGKIQTVTVSLNRLFADMAQLGSTASDFIGDLRQVAIKTPFEFIDLADTSRRLVQLGGDADTALERMNALADAGAAVGATSDDINGVVRALSQLKAKGRINLQDLNQVAERLPNFQRTMQLQGVIDELKDMKSPLAGTVHSFDDLRNAGVGIDTVINGIFRGLQNIPGAAGAAAAQARTLEGALSNLRDFAQIEFSDAFRNAGVTLAEELNSAFSSISDTSEETTSTMADGFREVISAFGVGLDDALPEVIAFTGEVSHELASMADAIGNLVESLASGFSGDLFRGLLDGLTGIINLATVANEVLSVLPAGFASGIGQVAANIIALTRIGIPAFAPFQKLINDMILSFKLASDAGTGLKGTLSLISSTAVSGAVQAAAGLAILTVVTNRMADVGRRNREFEQATNDATRSLEEFNVVGEAALDFIEKFNEIGAGINIGPLEEILNGLTSDELRNRLGLTSQGLANLVAELSTISDLEVNDDGLLNSADSATVLADAAEAAGVALEDIGTEETTNLVALSNQFGNAAEAAFKAAVETKRFGFVSTDVTDRINAATLASGKFADGLQDLEDANIAGAHSLFGTFADDLNLTGAEQRKIISNNTDLITGTIDWIGATGELKEQLVEVDIAMQDLVERAPDLLKLSRSFDQAATTGKDFRTALVDFADAAVDADLSAQELDAIVRDLGSNLTGEELKAKFTEIATALDEMTTSIETVLPGISDLQFEADTFSLNAFIEELEKIGEARTKVVSNVNAILDQFGTLGADAIDVLVSSGLNGDQFAIAIQGLIDGGQPKLEQLVSAFGKIGQDSAEELAKRMIAFGISEEDAKLIAGIDHFQTAGEQAGQKMINGFRLFFGANPGSIFAADELFGRNNGAEGAALAEPTVPSIDIPAAVGSAASAGEQVGTAFVDSTAATVSSQFFKIDTQVLGDIAALGTDFGPQALTAGDQLGKGIVFGLAVALNTSLKTTVGNSIGGLAVLAFTDAITVGNLIGVGLASGFSVTASVVLPTAFANIQGQLETFGESMSSSTQNIGALGGAGLVQRFTEQSAGLSVALDTELGETLDLLVIGMGDLKVKSAAGALAATVAFQNALRFSEAVSREMKTAFPPFLAGFASTNGFRIGLAFGTGLARGIRASIVQSAAAAIALVVATRVAMEQAAGISSPSKLFAGLGRNIALGVSTGMLAALPDVRKAAGSMIGAATVGAVSGPSVRNLSAGTASAAIRRLESSPAAPSRQLLTSGAPSPAGNVHHHTWHVSSATDDPETLARKVATRLEDKLR